jgi:hypothetical protein
MMLRLTLVALALTGCTYAQVSATPVQLPGGGEGFRYTGRANFAHQVTEADRVMAETCAARGGRPVVVEQAERNIGGGAILTGNTAMIGANRQQDIIFRCIS